MAKVTGVSDIPELPGAGMIHFDDDRPPLMAMPEVAEDYRVKLGIPSAMTEGVAGPGSGARDYAAEDRADFVDTMKAAGKGLYRAATTPIAGTELSQKAAARLGRDPNGQILSSGDSLNTPTIDPVSGQPLPPNTRVAGPGDAPVGAPAASAVPAPLAAPEAPQADEPPPVDPDADLKAAADRALLGSTETTSEGSNRTETTRGAPYLRQAAEQRIGAAQAVRDTELSRMHADRLMSEAQAADAAARIPYLKVQQAHAENELQRRQDYYREHRAGLEKELTDFDESHTIDPTRFFSGPNAVSAVMSVIGAGIGAAGASLTHTQNYAFDYLQQRIKDDIEAQRIQLQQGHGKRANALGRFVEYYQGDLNQAQTALEIAMKRSALAEVDRFGAQTKSREIAQNIPSFKAKFDQSILKDEQALMNQAIGTTKTETESKSHTVSKSTTAEDVSKLWEMRHGKPMSSDQRALLQEKYGEKRRALDDVWQSLDEQAQAMGLKMDRKTGQVLGANGKPVDPTKASLPGLGVVTKYAPGWWVGAEGRALRRTMSKAIDAYRKESTGVAYSPEELEKATDQYIGFNNEDTVRNFMKHVAEAQSKDRSLEAAYPEDVVGTRERRGVETNQEHSKAAAKAPRIKPL